MSTAFGSTASAEPGWTLEVDISGGRESRANRAIAGAGGDVRRGRRRIERVATSVRIEQDMVMVVVVVVDVVELVRNCID